MTSPRLSRIVGKAATPDQLERLRQLVTDEGRVDIKHKRHFVRHPPVRSVDHPPADHLIDPRGGRTTVTLSVAGGEYVGEARCSDEDNYNRVIGVRIALGRALAKAEGADVVGYP